EVPVRVPQQKHGGGGRQRRQRGTHDKRGGKPPTQLPFRCFLGSQPIHQKRHSEQYHTDGVGKPDQHVGGENRSRGGVEAAPPRCSSLGEKHRHPREEQHRKVVVVDDVDLAGEVEG